MFYSQPWQLHDFRQVLLEHEPEFLPALELSHLPGNLIPQARVCDVFDQVFKQRHCHSYFPESRFKTYFSAASRITQAKIRP